MKMKTASLLCSLLALPVGLAQACDAPLAPPVPDGSTATWDEMLSANSEIKAFMAASDDYLSCLDIKMKEAEADREEGDPTAEEKFVLAGADYNATVSIQEQLRDSWAKAMSNFYDANPDKRPKK